MIALGKQVSVELKPYKAGEQFVCNLKHRGIDINLDMLRKGYAWAFKKYLDTRFKEDKRYVREEDKAHRSRLGLWKKARQQPPWEYKKQMNREEKWTEFTASDYEKYEQ